MVRRLEGEPPDDGFLAPPGERDSARLRLDGRLLLLAGEESWMARARRLVPYASWLQGLPVLHAAAVALGGAAVALIGPSGVGKSTLAERLSDLGYEALYDDLTPCRERGGRFLVPLPRRSAQPLRALAFLARRRLGRPALEPMSRAAALRWLARNGWGDLALPSLWRTQFEFHCRLAADRPAFRLLMPDDGDGLAQAAAEAATLLAEV